jgi:putative ABC transport system ATP-binding protein
MDGVRAASSDIVVIRDLELSFYTRRRRIDVLRGVGLIIAQGERVALTGPSGAGKSTLLYCIAGLLRPQRGTISIGGHDLLALQDGARAAHRLHHVGIVYQAFHLLGALTAVDNVALPLRLAGLSRAAASERAKDLLDRVGLADRRHHRPAQLSGGEQQRVAVARAIANDPEILLADEPTGSLDAEAAATVLDLLHEEGSRRTLVLATHSPDIASGLDRIVRLDGGMLAPQTGVVAGDGHPHGITPAGAQTPASSAHSGVIT